MFAGGAVVFDPSVLQPDNRAKAMAVTNRRYLIFMILFEVTPPRRRIPQIRWLAHVPQYQGVEVSEKIVAGSPSCHLG